MRPGSTVIVALGSHDLRVADAAADLFLPGLAPTLIVTGVAGKVTGAIWRKPEAEFYAERAIARGVPESAITPATTSPTRGEAQMTSVSWSLTESLCRSPT
jgi:hypothetical protein